MFGFKGKYVFAGLAAGLLLLGWALPTPVRAENKIAVVDMERAVNECNAGKKAQAELKRKFDKLQDEMKVLGTEIETLRKELENTAVLLKPEAKLSKEREFERKVRLFNDRKRDATQEMNEARRDAFAPILRSMEKVIQGIGASGTYTLVLESRIALYAPKSADITAQVIAAYNKANP